MAATGDIRAGSRWRSTVSEVEVIVVKPPSSAIELRCGDAPMALSAGAATSFAATAPDGETLIGKRYQHEESGLLVLCTKGGAGALSVDGSPLTLQDTRALPASD